MLKRDIMRVYPHAGDILGAIAAALNAAQLIILDPNAKDLAADLVAWAHETAEQAVNGSADEQGDNA